MRQIAMKYLLLSFLLSGSWGAACAGPGNIAGEAKVTASSQRSDRFGADRVNDGIIAVPGKGEWACEGQTASWGYIRYPWIQLTWDTVRSINRIVLYDRPAPGEHTAGGILKFSDGSEIRVYRIPNDGSAKAVTFPARKVEWVRFVVTDGVGKDLGLSEIEVFPGPEDYKDYVSWVDPYIETTRGRYFFFVTGSLPFGMISAAPVTRNKDQWGGGYNYNDGYILGFGQVHGWMLSGLNIMPAAATVNPVQGEQAWKSEYDHESEIVQPGYQRVFLKTYKTWVEQTCTDRVSFYRFVYTKSMQANILIGLGGALGGITMADAVAEKTGDREITGSYITTGRFWGGPDSVRIFFAIQFDRPIAGLDGWKGKERFRDLYRLSGDSLGVAAVYPVSAGDTLRMKIAISYTSIANARHNMKAECDHWDFDEVRREAGAIWNDWLGKIAVEGGSEAQKTKFYTDLWHVLLGRHKLNDVSGDYPDYTEGERHGTFTDAVLKVRTLPRDKAGKVKFNMYNSDALWLTQWNLNILWGLAWPQVLDDFSASLVQYADNGGLLPRGPNAGGYSFIMTGSPATNLIVGAYMKGLLKNVDPGHAFETMKRNHMPGGMMGFGAEDKLKFYIKNGWCPDNAGLTVEWSFQDWSLAQMAHRLGKRRDESYFMKRSRSWENCYQADAGLLLPRREDGKWLHQDPLSGSGWIESNAWQASWGVSQDIPGLAKLMGNNDSLCKKLNDAFERSQDENFVYGYGNGYISYANQPGCSDAHVFNYAGKPWLTQYWVRQVKEKAFGGVTPDLGYGGHDEDQGQMGGLSALMAIGLFSLQGTNAATPVYEITSPVFDRITIRLDPRYYAGGQFDVKVYNNSPENAYIRKAALNGKPLDTFWFLHRDFARGGLLEIWLGPEPNEDWGVAGLPPAIK